MNAFRPYAENHYREDLRGLRAYAVILIVIYQIWINKESGGIDAVFVLSGFLMSSVLLRQYSQAESLQPFHFWAGIIKRVAPPVYLVLMVIFLLGPFILSQSEWRAALDDLLLSALHLENVQLIRNGVAPLHRSLHNPFEHFWAVSMHMQFYLLLPLLMGPVMFLSRVLLMRWPMMLWVILIILGSLAYSVSATHSHPASAYFHTATRLWEFFTGVLLALLVPLLHLGQLGVRIATVTGISLLVSTGLVISTHAPFPGIAALLPVVATSLLIMAGGQRCTTVPASRWLANQQVAYLGDAALAIYLWHWPLLVCAQRYFGTASLSLAQGLLVIVATLALGVLTVEIVESPFRRIPKAKPWVAYIVGTLCFAPVLAAWVGGKHHVLSNEQAARDDARSFAAPYYSGPPLHPQNNAQSSLSEHFYPKESLRPDK
jgi:peptidoglycan/LPS O-acetylase OafA/YrhL